MLILSRKQGESIVIQGRISVSVLEIRARRVRIGIEAPSEMSVQRKEILASIGERESREQRMRQTCTPKNG